MENEADSGFGGHSRLLGRIPPRVWPVGALCRAVGDALDARFGAVQVQGEVSGFVRAASGHCYFTLKDSDGQMRCAMFRRAASLMDWLPRDGELVQASGRLAVYEGRGELQLVVESLRRSGQGALYEAFLRIKAELQAQGLFDSERKRPLTAYPRGLGLVTSREAAALRDVATALQRRAPHVPVLLVPAPVQGAQAPALLIAALQRLYQVVAARQRGDAAVAHLPHIDTILLVRGGGSLDDLWAFNDAELARTITQSPVPVVVGVGHESDVTIADLCADLRAPTPTAAAELAALPADEAWAQAQQRFARIAHTTRRMLDRHAQTLDRQAFSLARTSSQLHGQALHLHDLALRLKHAQTAITQHRQRVQHVQMRLLQAATQRGVLHRQALQLQQAQQGLAQVLVHGVAERQRTLQYVQQRWQQAVQARLQMQHHRLQGLAQGLQLLHPMQVLQRGYALLQDAQNGQVLQRPADFYGGQQVRATLAEGEMLLTPLPGQATHQSKKSARPTQSRDLFEP